MKLLTVNKTSTVIIDPTINGISLTFEKAIKLHFVMK